jgi:starch synthase
MSLSIVMISSEAVPFAKTGGLADVVGALPRALARYGHRVTVFLPRYRGAAAGNVVAAFPVSLNGRTLAPRFHRHDLERGVTAVLIDSPELYDRDALYGIGNNDYPDNAFRFAFMSKAALEFAGRHLDPVDVVHAHDWQAGLAPLYLETLYHHHPVLGGAASVFTVHNLAYQGLFGPDLMPSLDLAWQLFAVEGIEYWGRISFLKAGINFSTLITTVSPTYAREVQTPEFGFGFEGILRRRSRDLAGILNGIDTERWNPMTDPALPEPFGASNLSGKRAAKREMLKTLGLPCDAEALAAPAVGIVSRMVDQKGFDLLSDAVSDLLRLGATYVLLGSGDPKYEAQWRKLAEANPLKVAVRIGFDDRLAHLIEGGSDLFLMPSRFEPCGLNQMYSLRYGTVPVVRAVGGLDDTVVNFNPKTVEGTGFKFRAYTGRALTRALRCALQVYRDPGLWRSLQQAGMRQDYSWAASAREYVSVYERARRTVPAAGETGANPLNPSVEGIHPDPVVARLPGGATHDHEQ